MALFITRNFKFYILDFTPIIDEVCYKYKSKQNGKKNQ